MTSYATASETASTATTGSTATTIETQSQQQQQQQNYNLNHHHHHHLSIHTEQEQQLPNATIVSPTSYTNISNAITTTTTNSRTKLPTGILNLTMDEMEQHQHHPHQQHQQDLSDCDCDSLSDGREKADTTPENIKKIDDIIELELQLERTVKRQQRSNSSNNNNILALNGASINVAVATTDSGDNTTYNSNESSNGIQGMHGIHSGIGIGVGISMSVGIGLAAAIDESNAKYCFVKKPALCTEKEAQLMESSNNVAVTPTSPVPPIETVKGPQRFESSNQSSSAETTAATTPISQTAAEICEVTTKYDDSSSASNTITTPTAASTTTTQTTAAASATGTQEDSETDGNASKRSCAFTLSFDNDDASTAAATAARYKSVMERFQSRHRRGASMSKLDNESNSAGTASMTASLTGDGLSLSSSASASPLTIRSTTKSVNKMSNVADTSEESVIPKVRLRPRDRSTSRVRDAAQRHSWSPRSSTSELSTAPPLSSGTHHTEITQSQSNSQSNSQQQQQQRPPTSARRHAAAGVKTKPPPPPPLVLPKGGANLVANRTQQFTPRSTAMQLALQKMDFMCPQAPLADYEHAEGEGDNVSEAGTYTLDGDNYTEEQKDLMNIDKSARGARRIHKHHDHHHKHHAPLSPTSPQKMQPEDGGMGTVFTKIPVRTSNVLEVNYFHGDADDTGQEEYFSPSRLKTGDFMLGNHQSAGAYLEKIKSRVLRKLSGNSNSKNLNLTTGAIRSETVNQSSNDDEDVGCFTSVTTSGVLAKKGALDPRPKLSRKNSLTTSQIDSSEYVSNEVKLKSAPSASTGGSYTDIQKAEYRLNLFTNQKDLHKYAATRNLIETPPETPSSTTDKLPSDTAALTLAQSKNDWIQQWARNARARSLASETACSGGASKLQQQQKQQLKANAMTRSYNCGTSSGGGGGSGGGSLTDESLYGHQFNSRCHIPGASDNEFDYSSDPSLLTSIALAKSHDQDGSGNASVKPPKSPSKIPSPLHSIGRARSASRTRGSLQGLMTAQEEEDSQNIYLQKTAAAINSLQQSLSRKNSLKSPTGSMSSPRMNVSIRNQIAMQGNEDGDSPQRSIESDGYHSQRHRRNLSNEGYSAAATAAQAQLMTSSFNEQQLQLLTSGEYLIKQMRMRKNSFDGNMYSPRRRIERAPEQTTLSPLHRGGSFSVKIANAGTVVPNMQQRSARPQFQNIYTPPAARQGYVPLLQSGNQQQQQQLAQIIMKKSASSNNFGQVYSDYDDNLEYYINDADDDELGVDLNIEDEDELEYGEYEYGDANEEYGPRTITLQAATVDDAPVLAPLTSTRYNKALLMRIERSKQRVAAASGTSGTNNKPASAPAGTKNALNNVAGLVACPNTPELPRRNVKSAPRAGISNARQSVPRDTSLSRLASQVPNSLASAKRQLLQTAAAGVPQTNRSSNSSVNQRVQPKYMDISKYKPAQGNAFLRKNEAKSTLKTPSSSTNDGSGIRRSPSSSGLSRTDPSRVSNRSMRSAMTSSCTGALGGGSASGSLSGNVPRASSAVRRDDSVTKQKEIEMAMWKRRSTYDPLKAAAEDRRRKEEAKRLSMSKNANEVLCERQSRSHYRRGQF